MPSRGDKKPPSQKFIHGGEETAIAHLVDFFARLDTLHDFCGKRCIAAVRPHIKGYTNISPSLVQTVKGILRSRNAPPDTEELIDRLCQYMPFKDFKSFEWSVLELAKRVREAFGDGVKENPFLFEEGFTETNFEKVLLDAFNLKSDRDRNKYIIDTSGINQDEVLCKTGKVAITGATLFDKKTGINIQQECQDNVQIPTTEVSAASSMEPVSLNKNRKECMFIKEIRLFDRDGDHWMELKYKDDTTHVINFNRMLNYGVAKYSQIIHEIRTTGKAQALATFYSTVFGGDIQKFQGYEQIQAIFDFKRSGDWLQIESYRAVARPDANTIFFTIDRPAVARALLKSLDHNRLQIPVVCTGKDSVKQEDEEDQDTLTSVKQITTYGQLEMRPEMKKRFLNEIRAIREATSKVANFSEQEAYVESIIRDLKDLASAMYAHLVGLHQGATIQTWLKTKAYSGEVDAPNVTSAWSMLMQHLGCTLYRAAHTLESLLKTDVRMNLLRQVMEIPVPQDEFQDEGIYKSAYSSLMDIFMHYKIPLRMLMLFDMEVLSQDLADLKRVVTDMISAGYANFKEGKVRLITPLSSDEEIDRKHWLMHHARDVQEKLAAFCKWFDPVRRGEVRFHFGARSAGTTLAMVKKNYKDYQEIMEILIGKTQNNLEYCKSVAGLNASSDVFDQFEGLITMYRDTYIVTDEPEDDGKVQNNINLEDIRLTADGRLPDNIKSFRMCLDMCDEIAKKVSLNLQKIAKNPAINMQRPTANEMTCYKTILLLLKDRSAEFVKENNPNLPILHKRIDAMVQNDIPFILAHAKPAFDGAQQCIKEPKPEPKSKKRPAVSPTASSASPNMKQRSIKRVRRGGAATLVARANDVLHTASQYHVFPYTLAYLLCLDGKTTVKNVARQIAHVPKWDHYISRPAIPRNTIFGKSSRWALIPLHMVDRTYSPLVEAIDYVGQLNHESFHLMDPSHRVAHNHHIMVGCVDMCKYALLQMLYTDFMEYKGEYMRVVRPTVTPSKITHTNPMSVSPSTPETTTQRRSASVRTTYKRNIGVAPVSPPAFHHDTPSTASLAKGQRSKKRLSASPSTPNL